MKSIPRLVWVVPAILLVVAAMPEPLPCGYYTFTRIVTYGVAAIIALVGFRDRPVSQWSVALALLAVLSNPFVPIRLSRQTWVYLDIGAVFLFGSHLIFVRCAPYPLRVRRIFRALIFMALAVPVSYGALLLFRCATTITKPQPWPAQDIQFLPWWLGVGLFFLLGSGVLIYYLFKNPVRDTRLPHGDGNTV